jgi:hypothetical protein
MLPAASVESLQDQLVEAHCFHERDLAAGFCEVTTGAVTTLSCRLTNFHANKLPYAPHHGRWHSSREMPQG